MLFFRFATLFGPLVGCVASGTAGWPDVGGDPADDSAPADTAVDTSVDTSSDTATDSGADTGVDTGGSEGLAGGWSIEHSEWVEGALFLHPVTADKDASMVASRLASALSALGVVATSDSREALITPLRMSDTEYGEDVADFIVDDLYGTMARAGTTNQSLLGTETLVFTSVHRFGLYVAETLHARVLPLQYMSFADDWSQVEAASERAMLIVGQDSDYSGLWVWNKYAGGTPGTAAGTLPAAYLRAMAEAETVVIVQPDDNWTYCSESYCSDVVNEVYTGADTPIFLHTSITRSGANNAGTLLYDAAANAGLLAEAADVDVANLKQWEWGVPDSTVANVRAAWAELGKPPENLIVIAGGVVDMYAWSPWLWKAYLEQNGVAPRGIHWSSYWVAQTQLERAGAVLPNPSYSYYQPAWHPLDDNTRALLDGVCSPTGCEDDFAANSRAFVNEIGSTTDKEGTLDVMVDYGLDEASGAWFGYGINARGTAPWTGWNDETVPSGWEQAAIAMQDSAQAPYFDRVWNPLTIGELCAVGPFACQAGD